MTKTIRRNSDYDFIEHLSGGNHELFHTNLLAYIAKKYPEYFIAILPKECSKALKGNEQNYRVEREEKHFDLAIKDDNGNYLLVIENKMKSTPDPGQLDEYAQKSEDAEHLLLTMIETDDESIPSWHQMTYRQLAENMNNKFKFDYFDGYFASFLADYIRYISYVSEKVDGIKFDGNCIAREWLSESTLSDNQSSWEQNFFQKARFQKLAEEIKKAYGAHVICEAGIVRGYTPFIDIWPILKFDNETVGKNVKEWKKESREKKYSRYWCQLYSDHIERGFLLYFDSLTENEEAKETIIKNTTEAKPKRGINRHVFLADIWDEFMKISEFKDVAKRLGLPMKFDKNISGKGESLFGYIYADKILVYVREDYTTQKLNDIIAIVAKEMKIAHEIFSKKFINQ